MYSVCVDHMIPGEQQSLLPTAEVESSGGDLQKGLLLFHDACVFNKGNGALQQARRNGGGGGPRDNAPADPDAGWEGAEVVGAADVWHVAIAQTANKVSNKLQMELLNPKVLTFFTEWCGEPDPRVSAVAYTDISVVYDQDGIPVSFLDKRSPDNNIYIGVRSALLGAVDPVLEAALQRVQDIYSATFWSIPEAFKFCQAAQALAKRGHNVDVITVFWGPGGAALCGSS